MPVFVDGHHLITPTSVAKTGTGSTATINTNGSVTFSSCETLSLNGVFSADYDNYIIIARSYNGSTSSLNVELRLRSSGTDASGSNYTWQWIEANGTSVSGLRTSSTTQTRIGLYLETSKQQGAVAWVYGPYLTQPTAFRGIAAGAYLGGYLIDYASTHSLSTSYDGVTFLPSSAGAFSGLVCVYGAVK